MGVSVASPRVSAPARLVSVSSPGSTEEALAPAPVERLVAEHRRFLAFLERRVGDRALAEDILNQAFVKTLERGGELRDAESAVAWFYRMLRNAVTDHHRRSGAARRAVDAFARELEATTTPESELHHAVCECIGELADTLKPEHARALRRVEVDGIAVKDLAEELGIKPNAAAARLLRARDALRRRLKECCGSCAEHGCVDCHCKA